MKTQKLIAAACFMVGSILSVSAQSGVDSTGLPGDHFSLQAALHVFQESSSPEAFEAAINDENNHVNNLDLNDDGEIDYIRVEDKSKDDLHVLILQAVVGEKNFQDIATIEIEKTGKEEAILQIIGDEDIYGEEVIIEAIESNDDMEKGKGPSINADDQVIVIVNVWSWPMVKFMYAPAYRPWISPYRWRFYPVGWRPWRPIRWSVFHPFHVRYHSRYILAPKHRTIRARAVYRPHRTTSVTVKTRHSAAIGNYRVTKEKKTITGPRGNTVTKKTTTVKRGGEVKSRKTSVKRGNN